MNALNNKMKKMKIKNKKGELIFDGADLRDADLRDANLSRADLSRADLSRADLNRADLSRADLRDANLRDADLSDANLCGAYLSRADLSRADLRDADLRDANLCGAYLSGAYLSYANLRGADLSRAYLSRADLSGAYLSYANLSYANLSYANLIYANLSYANLRGAKNFPQAEIDRRTITPEGSIIGWKKLNNGTICKLEIPEGVPRVGGVVDRKCRAASALVLEGEGVSWRHPDPYLDYKPGKVVVADEYDPNPLIECSGGIHFFLTEQEAKDW